MFEIKACAVCFSTEVHLHDMAAGDLREQFNLVSGLQTCKESGMLQHLCVECTGYVRRFKKFRDKCHRAHFAFLEILSKNKQINQDTFAEFDRKLLDIMPNLSYAASDNVHYLEMKFKWLQHNRNSLGRPENIPAFHCTTINNDLVFEVPKLAVVIEDESGKVKMENKELDCSLDVEPSVISLDAEEIEDIQDVCEQSTSNIEKLEMTEDSNINKILNDIFDDDDDVQEYNFGANCQVENNDGENDVDGSQLDEEYATITALTMSEVRAVVDVYRMFGQGKHKCQICHKSYQNENRLKVHMRMHDTHVSGTFYCGLCCYYYKTEFLLKTHMTDKHMYKYVCKKCPEVSYDKTSAKQHYIWAHLQKGCNKDSNWYDVSTRPSWLSNRGGKRNKNVLALRPIRKPLKIPKDFPKRSAIPQVDQYMLVQERKDTRNYVESHYKCQLCYRGFREARTFSTHMKKHDPSQSGKYQCDMCKLYFIDARKMYKHMIVCHIFKYSCQICKFVCYNRSTAYMHYRWHKNVTYKCPHCDKEFHKISTRLTHIRVKHPSTCICNLCGHSFVSDTGLYYHRTRAHTMEEVEKSDQAPINEEDPLYCTDCKIQFQNLAAYTTHFGSSSKHSSSNESSKPMRRRAVESGRRRRDRRTNADIVNNGMRMPHMCEICNESLVSDIMVKKHYETEHPGTNYLKRYMCDICGHATKQYSNLMVHMRTHTQEKPYSCPHCDRKFSMISNRDRHLVVHTGEKRYQCQHCSRRFTQSSAVKLHIQTVHLKIPYAPWDKKNRKRRKELENAGLSTFLQPPQKYAAETQGDYLNAYINYSDE